MLSSPTTSPEEKCSRICPQNRNQLWGAGEDAEGMRRMPRRSPWTRRVTSPTHLVLLLINLAFNIDLKLAEELPQLPVRGIFIE